MIELTRFALQLVQSSTEAESIANKVYDASSGLADLTLMYSQIAQLVMENKDISENTNRKDKISNGEIPKSQKRKPLKPAMAKDDIRYVVQMGYKRGLTTEEALEEKRYIRAVDELLDLISL